LARLLHCAVLLTLATALFGQATPPKGDANKKPAKPQEQVAPDDMVILISGACQTAPLEFAVRDCVRGVTRQEFEDMLQVAAPNATPQVKQQLADRLARIIILSNEAKKLEVPKDPAVKQYLRFVNMEVLANLLLSKTMKEQAAKQVSDVGVVSYYQEHKAEFDSAEFLRVAVPSKTGETADMRKQFAETLRSRCAAGEDPNKLQAEADQRAEQKETPAADLKEQRASAYPEAQRTIFALKQGDCAVVAPDENQVFVYKMVAMSTAPLEQVRQSIVAALESEYIKNQLETLKNQNAVSFNDKYFPSANPSHPAQPAPSANPK
jgi:hypothetical protein